MMPPTSIDGTDITGATIDGTDVTEITVDGDTVFTATTPIHRASDLEHHIPFRGTATDVITSSTFSSTGSPTIVASGGANDPYAGGDGDDSQYAEFTPNEDFNNSSIEFNQDKDFTLMAWVQPDGASGEQNMISSDSGRVCFRIVSGNHTAIKFDGGNNIVTGSAIDTTQWQHLAMTHDKSTSTIEFFIDGVSQGTNTSGFNFGGLGVHIGSQFSNGRFYDGDVDDVRYYGAVLSQSDISTIIGNTDPN